MEFLPGFDPGSFEWELTWWTAVTWVGKLLGIAHIPSVLLQRGTRPMAALAWILCLLAIPYLGVILWWILGRNHVQRRNRKRTRSQARISQSFHQLARTVQKPDRHLVESTSELLADQRRAQLLLLHDEHGVFPTTRHNTVTIYSNARDGYDAFEAAVRSARRHIHFQFYIWRADDTGRRFRDLLVEKAREGVEVRVLYDAVGGAAIKGRFMKPLLEAGAEVAPFLPVRLLERRLRINFRNHRKIIVVDNQVAFTGGINIGDEYHDWMDLAFGLKGPVVFQLQETFAEDWFFATCDDLADQKYFRGMSGSMSGSIETHEEDEQEATPILLPGSAVTTSELVSVRDETVEPGADVLAHEPLPLNKHGLIVHRNVNARVVASGPDDTLSTIQKMFFLAITRAKERVYIMTPYFVPDHAIITALQTAAMRGVDVRLLVPAISDVPITSYAGRSYFEVLLEVGVRIFEYKRSVLHAKVLVFDREHAIVGSANMDIRSFRFNFEANCVFEARALNQQLSALFLHQLKDSQEVRLEHFKQRPKRERLVEGLARLLSPLL